MHFDTNLLEFDKVINLISPYCKTKSGKDKLLNLRPINDINLINEELKLVNEAYNSVVKMSDIPIVKLSDLKDSISRAEIGSILTSEELFNIAILLDTAKNCLRYFKDLDNNKVKTDTISRYFELLYENKRLLDEIKSTVSESFEILDNASMELFKIRRRIQMEENHLRSYMNSLLLSKSSMLNESIIALRDGRLCLPVKAEHKNNIKGIVHDMSQSGTTYYIEPAEANEITLKIENLKLDEKKEINIILKNLSIEVGSVSSDLINSFDAITYLDFIFAKALYAKDYDMVLPKINDKGFIELIDAAHPLIDRNIVVKNSVTLGKKYNTIIITGPNTGGKTVVLKLVGLLTLMAQAGLFIPAKEGSSLAIFDNVFVDIGDEQSIEQNLSTFSSHMTRIAKICKNVTENSLVLLDEVGSGTDPKEGASLAIAIIDYLTEIGSKVISTTHYSDLKAYAYNNDKTINASVLFKLETLEPTYKLEIGIPGRSNALLISKRLGLSQDILDKANEYMESDSTESQSLIKKIDEENQKVTKLKELLENKIKEENRRNQKLNDELNQFKKEKDMLLYKAKREADLIIEEAKEKSQDLLSKLDQIKKDKEITDKDLAEVKFEARNLKVKEEKKQDNTVLEVGDIVNIPAYNTEGTITLIKKDRYDVQFGQFKMTFKRNEIEFKSKKLKEKKVEAKKPVTLLSTSKHARMQLDLRGYRYEEVAPALDLFIEEAYVAHYEVVYIIHGFGTGAVREAVYAYLKKSNKVKSTRFGGEGEGLNGCTVVTLK